jgi:polyhydroxybutyrate depolymerase
MVKWKPSSVLFLAIALAAAPATAEFGAGSNFRELEFGGRARDYRVYVPASYDGATPTPLIMDIHGLSSNANQQFAISGLALLSEAEGFIISHPNGISNAWNAGFCCGNRDIDDVAFIRAVVAAIQAEANIDPTRIYATGLSNGGAMTHRLACDAGDLFAAAAPVAFPIPFLELSECRPSRSIPVLTFMGLTDVLVPYEGGGAFSSAADTFAYWSAVNGCGTGTPQETVVSGDSRCETHTECANGVQTGLCSITARAFPGLFFDGHILFLNEDFDLAALIWAFVSRFRLEGTDAPASGTLAGKATLKLKGVGQAKQAVEWSLTLGHGTWWAADPDGNVFTGSHTARDRKGRRLTLTLSGESQTLLLGVLATQAAELVTTTSAAQVEPSEPLAFSLALKRRGAQAKLTAKLPVAPPAGSTRGGRYTLKLRGALTR